MNTNQIAIKISGRKMAFRSHSQTVQPYLAEISTYQNKHTFVWGIYCTIGDESIAVHICIKLKKVPEWVKYHCPNLIISTFTSPISNAISDTCFCLPSYDRQIISMNWVLNFDLQYVFYCGRRPAWQRESLTQYEADICKRSHFNLTGEGDVCPIWSSMLFLKLVKELAFC